MKDNKKVMLIFGGACFQLSLIKQCKSMGFYTVVIDPNPTAIGQFESDAFEVVNGQDFEGTCNVMDKYEVDHIITVATDKPLLMMQKISAKYNLPFISREAVENSTDKFRMKEVFVKNGIPCAKYKTISEITDNLTYPMVIKPRDNSGSRGVILCNNKEEALIAFKEAIKHTKLDTLLCESVIGGKEYSLESIHYNGKTKLLQITDKIMTPLPYSVEMELTHPCTLSEEKIKEIEELVHKISVVFEYDNCASHNEIRINDGKITVIEVSPRMAGDNIGSHLVPLSTGINMEKALIDVVSGKEPDLNKKFDRASGIFFFDFPAGKKIKKIHPLEHIKDLKGVAGFKLDLKEGDTVPRIVSSGSHYGYIILHAVNRKELYELKNKAFKNINIEFE
ncbi:MAG TPA: ATP-grasp domain-containing protein [Salinivirgaceae bacterium]|nr:ATP-grasp domain-containing protein [Salinivirgaceae bacterium]